MLRMGRRIGAWMAGGLALVLVGCPAFYKVERDVERTPVVNTGAGASIIYPGQTAPRHPGNQHPHAAGSAAPTQGQPGAAPASGEAARRSSGAPPPGGGGGITMIGGSTVEEERHQKIEEEPIYWKYFTLPFAIAAAPFAYVWEKLRGEPEPGPEVPKLATQPPPQPAAPPPVDYETRQLEDMERELARREGTPLAPTPVPQASDPAPPSPKRLSIADELAALRAPSPPTPRVQPATTARAQPAPWRPRVVAALPGSLAAASGHVDRDGDGRTDHWIFRERGDIARELFDEDFDGNPDRSLHYDLTTHQVARIEEDANRDGQVDSWTTFRDGQVVRRRSDTDANGQVDTWTFYKNGVVTRLERDATGDGFRDHIAHYRDGRLERDEKDGDADGAPDLVTWYDDAERVLRVEEDADGDGQLDVVSHYENGRLARRELLDASLLDAGEPR